MPEDNLADWKGALARGGHSTNEIGAMYARVVPATDTMDIVLLDNVFDARPAYAIVGYVNCPFCDGHCYLGSQTLRKVQEGFAPMCLRCSKDQIAGWKRHGHVVDPPAVGEQK